ncbi:putative Restin-like protein [Hypsibius exemplaris]|uniref:Restin-like protein n=1 Tax=Hypsibius exemplaris TaxID=2072580 RepID=A0A1W0WVW7_HYPEX|nr:putative Restin-like protein [Hypsibius exemplaris]
MSNLPKPSSAASVGGPRPAGMPSSAQRRVDASPIHPQPPRATPPTGALTKAPHSGSIHFTEDTENFIVGDRVWVSGIKAGKIQFIGETKFAAGEWAGVVLDDLGTGKNDGSVAGVRYFQCEPNRGVFVRLHKLSRVPLSKEEIEAVKMQTMSAATSVGSVYNAVENELKTPGSGNTTEIGGIKVGQRVWLSEDRTGIVRFLGKPHFKEGIWCGIELDEPSGKNDGSVEGRSEQKKMSNLPKHPRPLPLVGRDLLACQALRSEELMLLPFIHSHQEQPLRQELLLRHHIPTVVCFSHGSIHFTEDTENFIVGDRVWVSGIKAGKIQFIGETKFAAGEWAGVVLDDLGTGKNDGSVAGVRFFQCEPIAASSYGSGNTTEIGGIKVGQRVWLSEDRTGIVRFLGKPHFKEGIWCGIELDEPSGKNDGSVEGRRYFTCTPNHGVFAPIAKVSKAPLPHTSDEPRTPKAS